MEISQEFLSRYLGHRREDFFKCKTYLADENFDELEKIGHQLKGNGLTFGFPDLTEIGMELEKRAKYSDLESLRDVVEKFSRWIRERAS